MHYDSPEQGPRAQNHENFTHFRTVCVECRWAHALQSVRLTPTEGDLAFVALLARMALVARSQNANRPRMCKVFGVSAAAILSALRGYTGQQIKGLTPFGSFFTYLMSNLADNMDVRRLLATEPPLSPPTG